LSKSQPRASDPLLGPSLDPVPPAPEPPTSVGRTRFVLTFLTFCRRFRGATAAQPLVPPTPTRGSAELGSFRYFTRGDLTSRAPRAGRVVHLASKLSKNQPSYAPSIARLFPHPNRARLSSRSRTTISESFKKPTKMQQKILHSAGIVVSPFARL